MDDTLKRIENIFRGSSSSDELFDSFQEALKLPITEIQTYKILLGNPTLTSDEVKMYAEKLVKQFPQQSFETLLWAGRIFESQKEDQHRLEDSIRYYQRAFYENPHYESALVYMLNLYNYDIEVVTNAKIIDFVESAVVTVTKKSRVYFRLSEHFKQLGNLPLAARYLALGEKSAEREID
jgi:hypothetical protein